MINRVTKGISAILCFIVISIGFYLFTFNSGYGYDALEYLVIGRSLLEGYQFYSFIPSKSFGIYYLSNFFLSLGNFSNHYGVSVLITLIFCGMLLSTFFIVKKILNLKTALLSSALIGMCAFFMEMNFLEPEGCLYICALIGFYYINRAIKRKRNIDLILGGFWMGLGFAFKSIAGFYFIAAAVFIFFWEYFRAARVFINVIKMQLNLLLGLAIALAIPVAYFLLSGKLSDYLEWTYYFPLFKYPANTDWLYKMYSKVLWFWALLILAIILSFNAKVRKKIYSNSNNLFLIFMGGFPLISLLKTQAPHYLFPGASFLSIYIAIVLTHVLNRDMIKQNKKLYISILIMVFATLALNVYLYKPAAIRRLVSISDYSREMDIRAAIQKHVPEGKKAIFFRNSALLYWLSHRYPNIPFVNFDVQTAYKVEKNPELILDALLDPALVLVEFNPNSIGIEDRNFLQKENNKLLMQRFFNILNRYFIISDINMPPYVFWERRDFVK